MAKEIPLNHNPEETDKFAALASRWWDPNGPVATLHQVNPLRLDFIKNAANLSNVNCLDIGCGGGILSESLAASGAKEIGRAHV